MQNYKILFNYHYYLELVQEEMSYATNVVDAD